MTRNEVISQIKTSLQDSDFSKVIFFWLYSKRTQTNESYIDLLVVTNDTFVPESFARKMEIKLKIANALHTLRKQADLDLIVHTKPMHDKFIELNSIFKREILSTGIIIYEANN